MQNFRKVGALLGAGAVIFSLAGCADRNGNGQPDSAATGGEVGNAAAGATNAVANTGDAASNTASNAVNAVANAGDAAANSASNAGREVANAASNAGQAASNAAAGASNTVAQAGKSVADAVTGAGAAATLTPKIKTALGGQKALNGSDINVNTDASKKTVILKGTVKNAAQKTLAGAIAKKNSADFKVDNQLTVK